MELLNDMALFVEVAKAMSFRRAANTLEMPSSTLSRRISALEKMIGLRLLHRTTRKIELTEAGQLYYERCRGIVEEARLAHEQLSDLLEQPSGLLRISLTVEFATIFLAPLLAEFAQLYPQMSFELDLTPRNVDLVTEPFDIAIRMGELPSSHLIARQLTHFTIELYASPRYLERYGQPQHPHELVQHACLGFMKNRTWTLHDAYETVAVRINDRFVLNNMGMIRRLATLDLGIALLPTAVAADDVASGQLLRVLPEWQSKPIAVYALTETRLLPAKTQRFIEFLRDRLGH